jgi:mRNA interferase MazF
VLLLSRDEAYQVRTLVTVAPVTTRLRGIPVEVPLGPDDGLPRPCAINLDTITTIARAALQERITALRPDRIRAVEAALHFALGLESCTAELADNAPQS